MINRKPKKCVECGREDLPHFSKKRCKFCASKGYKKLASKTIRKVSKIKDKSELNIFFEEAIKLSKKHPYSFESGKLLTDITRVNIAHLFPKRRYKSLSTNIDNFVLLTWEEHTQLDNYLDKMDLESVKKYFPKTFDKMLKVYEKYKGVLESGNLKEKFESYGT